MAAKDDLWRRSNKTFWAASEATSPGVVALTSFFPVLESRWSRFKTTPLIIPKHNEMDPKIVRNIHHACLRVPGPCLVFMMLFSGFAGMASAQGDLSGVIDIHAHTLPSSRPRSIDAVDLAKLAKQRGMRAIVIKDHYEPTASQAYFVRKAVPGIEVFGGIVLNRSVGGINVTAVERMALTTGGWGRIVWLPTFDAENQVKFSKENRPFVPVSENGHLVAPLVDLIAFVKDHPQLALATGHISAEEGLMVVREAHRQGVQHIIVTHPMEALINMTTQQMQEAAHDGAYIEFVYSALLGKTPIPLADYVNAIKAIGPASCILSSDFGQPENPPHTDGLAAFFKALRGAGIPQSDIDTMSKTNPAIVLGLQ